MAQVTEEIETLGTECEITVGRLSTMLRRIEAAEKQVASSGESTEVKVLRDIRINIDAAQDDLALAARRAKQYFRDKGIK